MEKTKEEMEKLFQEMAAFVGVHAKVKIGPVPSGNAEICWNGERYEITVSPDSPDQYRSLLHECSHAILDHVDHVVQTDQERVAWERRYQEWHQSGVFPEKYHLQELDADSLADQLVAELAALMGVRCDLHFGLKIKQGEQKQ
jgi:hypothetical protein